MAGKFRAATAAATVREPGRNRGGPIEVDVVPTSLRKQPGSGIRWPSLAACFIGMSAACLALVSLADEVDGTPPGQDAAGAAFERLKGLEGTWRLAEKDGHPLRIRFYPTARGHGLVEAWDVDGRSHSLTIYHRDGDSLLATHYCPQGNQPRMALVDGPDGSIAFRFRDVTDLDASTEQHQHDLGFDFAAAGKLVRSETYRDGEGKLHPSRLVLERVPE